MPNLDRLKDKKTLVDYYKQAASPQVPYSITTDWERCGELIARAFQPNYYNHYVTHGASLQYNIKDFQSRCKELIANDTIIMESDDHTAVAVWIPPEFDYYHYQEPLDPDFRAAEQSFHRCADKFFQGGPFWHLTMLAKDPSRPEVKGSTSKVIKPVLDDALERNIPAALECIDERARVIYEYYGFKTYEVVNIGVVSTTDPYKILGVDRSATATEIKKAYRKLALNHHPDKVTEELREEAEIKFKEISAAYEILADEAKREHYDTYGDEKPNHHSHSHGGYDDYGADFFSFFAGAGGARGAGGSGAHRGETRQRTEDAHLDVNVTLADLYNGKTVKITSTRNILCKLCSGQGVKKGAKPKQCGICHGQGYVRKIRRVAPGMVTQDYVDCTTCKGKGHTYKTKDKCKKCNGSTTEEQTKILEFIIERGSRFGDRVVLRGESDEAFGKVAGDVILTIHQKFTTTKSPFERIRDDLYTDLNVSLTDALCGFKDKIVLKHLDGRLLKISIPTGKVLRPNQFLEVTNEGFPIKNSNERGNLYLKIKIEFPPDHWFSEKSDLQRVADILPFTTKVKPNETLDEDKEEKDNKSDGENDKEDEDISVKDQDEANDSNNNSNVDHVDFKILEADQIPFSMFEQEDDDAEDDDYDGYDDGYDYDDEYTPGCSQQ